jgi:hypothetical protein
LPILHLEPNYEQSDFDSTLAFSVR